MDVLTYLNFIASLESSPDQNISDIIDEQAQFVLLGQPDVMTSSNTAVDNVFNNLNGLAKDLEEKQIEKQTAENALSAASGGIFHILGLDSLVSKLDGAKSAVDDAERNLKNHVSSADTDITNQIGGPLARFFALFKQNNIYFVSISAAGLSQASTRSILYNFVEYISKNGGATVANFRKYSHVARMTMDSANISKIKEIFNEFSGSDKGEAQIKLAMTKLKDAGLDSDSLGLTTNLFFNYLLGTGVSSGILNSVVESTGISSLGISGVVLQGLLSLSLAGSLSTVMGGFIGGDLFGFGDISNTIDNYNQTINNFDKARQQYKDYFQRLHDAAVQYNSK